MSAALVTAVIVVAWIVVIGLTADYLDHQEARSGLRKQEVKDVKFFPWHQRKHVDGFQKTHAGDEMQRRLVDQQGRVYPSMAQLDEEARLDRLMRQDNQHTLDEISRVVRGLEESTEQLQAEIDRGRRK